MSKKLVRDATYEMECTEEKVIIRLKKWSARKWFRIVGEVGDLVDEAMIGMNSNFDSAQFMAKLVVVICNSSAKAVMIVKESIDSPKLEDEEILEWDMEDFLGVVDKALELNLTTSIQKKMESAMGRIFKKSEEDRRPAPVKV